MTSGSAQITSTPSKDVELKESSSPSRFREGHTYTYVFGFRKSGDFLIDFRRDHERYASPQDVKLLVKCRAEPGQHITNASISVKQSSEKRDGRIVDGGIGQDHITIEIDAGSTYWFDYEVCIYATK